MWLPRVWFYYRYKCGAVRIRRQFIEELWVESGVLPEDEWRDLAREKLIEFEDQLHDAFRAGLNSYSGQRTWGFWDAVVYSLTAISTIGTRVYFDVITFFLISYNCAYLQRRQRFVIPTEQDL